MSEQPRVWPDPAMGLLAIYDTTLPQSTGTCCRNLTLAQDLTAETFLAAVTAARQQSTPPITIGWLIGVARHKLADHWRRAERARAAFQSIMPVDPDPAFAVELRARLERALLAPEGIPIASSPAVAANPRHGDLAYLTHAVTDTARAQAFYGAVLGWTFRPGRVPDGWQIEGTHPRAGMHGGAAQPGIEPVYQVDDLTAALSAVREHGGQAGEPQQQPYGQIAKCIGNQRTPFQLLQS